MGAYAQSGQYHTIVESHVRLTILTCGSYSFVCIKINQL